LFTAAGRDFEQLKLAARQRDFRPIPLPLRASLVSTQTVRSIHSRNVVGMLPGADPTVRDEWVIYTAHWDHLGRDSRLPGDQIYNGALDNATGSAGLLELARAFVAEPRPRRSLLFLAVTAEEQGLLGARHYAAHPLHPLSRTLANLNLDGVNTRGRTHNVAVIGAGNSSLEELLRDAAARQDRTVEPEETPEKGYFYRSDHFEFARVGVPALYFKSGLRYRNRPVEWGRQQHDLYTERDYHKVTDEIKPDWELTGGMEDLQLLFAVGREVANGKRWPEWTPGAEFKSIRERSLRDGK
jgi:Zn-dependent M28 family amino/carboxypeptidase